MKTITLLSHKMQFDVNVRNKQRGIGSNVWPNNAMSLLWVDEEENNCAESDSGKWWQIHIVWMKIKSVLCFPNKKDSWMRRPADL